jgi:hypothetical protein
LVLKNGSDECFATTDFTCQQAKVHAAFEDDIHEAIQGLKVLGAAVKEAGVPGGLKGASSEVPVLQ